MVGRIDERDVQIVIGDAPECPVPLDRDRELRGAEVPCPVSQRGLRSFVGSKMAPNEYGWSAPKAVPPSVEVGPNAPVASRPSRPASA